MLSVRLSSVRNCMNCRPLSCRIETVLRWIDVKWCFVFERVPSIHDQTQMVVTLARSDPKMEFSGTCTHKTLLQG